MSISIAQKYIDGMRQGLGVDLSVDVYPSSSDRSFKLTKSNIVQGTFVIDRTVCSGDVLEIGSAIAAELSFTMKNEPFTDPDGKSVTPADVIFEGANLIVNLKLHNPSDSETVVLPLGIFVVDEQPRKLSTISIKALDYMMRFDYAHNGSLGTSLLATVQSIVQAVEMQLSSDSVTFLNRFGGVYTLPDSVADKEGLTARQILMWVGEMTASCAYVDENGYLAFKQYPQSALNALTITEADRYSSDLQETDITITGITVTPTDSESEAVTIGTQGYEWNIEGNQLLLKPEQMSSAPLGYSENDKFFKYRPFTASTKAFPHLWPLDVINFSKNSDGTVNVHRSVITQHTWKLNGGSSIVSVGKSARKKGYASQSGLTAKQKAVIERAVGTAVKSQISGYQQAILDINKQAQGALGLYNTKNENTGVIYFHNQPDIEDSTYIYMETSAGRFMATGPHAWNDGNPVWTNAWTSMGQIVAHSMAAGTITTDMLNIGGAANPVYNLMTAGDFVDPNGGIGWSKAANDGTANNAPQSAATGASASDGVYPVVGRECMRILVGTATGSYPNIINNYLIPVVAGNYYTASYYFRRQRAEDTRWCHLVIDWLKADETKVSTSTIKATDYNTNWNRYSAKVQCPTGATQAKIRFYVESNNNYIEGTTVRYNNCYTWLCGVMLEEGEALHEWDNGISPSGSNVIIDRTGIDIYNGAIRIFDENGNLVFSQSSTGALGFTGEMTAKFKNSSGQDTAYLKITNEDYANQDYATAAIKIFDNTNSLFARIEAYKAAYTDTNSNSTVVFPTLEIAAIGTNSSLGLSAGDYSVAIDSTGITHTGPTTLLGGLYIPGGQNINVANMIFLTTQTATKCFYIGNSNWDIHSKAKTNYFDNDIIVDGISFKAIADKVL